MTSDSTGRASGPGELDADVFPLSFAQQRLWFLEQLDPGSATYNIPVALRLTGKLDVDAFAASLNAVVARHEALRTTFAVMGGEPRQIVRPALAVAMPVDDLRALDAERQRAELPRRMDVEARTPFDLARGPLLRGSLLRLADDEHVLLLTMHHIVSDGWSMGVLVREMALFYAALATGVTAALPELPIQYADYSDWQREWLQGETLAEQLGYWREQLAGARPLELPTDRPRPAHKSNRGAQIAVTLDSDLVARLRELARRENATPFMTLLAAWQILLGRYAGQRDVVVGSPIANRTRTETEALIGFFANTLALRTNLRGRPTFRELLARVRKTCLEAYAHQDVPFERVVDAVQPERDMSRTPLFQVMFVLQNAPRAELQAAGLELEPLAIDSGTSKFDLTLTLSESDEGPLTGSLEYDSDLFDRETVERLWRSFALLLEAAIDAADERIDVLPLLDAAARKQLAFVSGVSVDTGKALVHELVAARAAETPDAVAIEHQGETVRYAELEARSNRLARYLRARGVERGDVVGLHLERLPERVIALLAVLKTGAAFLPLDPSYPAERLQFMLQDARCRLVLAHEAAPLASETVLDLTAAAAAIEREAATPFASLVGESDPAYVIYTSGSTGRPKGAVNLHRGLRNVLSWLQRTFEAGASDVFLHKTLFGFDPVVDEILLPLATGARLVLAPAGAHRDAEELVRLVDAHAVTILHMVPSMLWAFLDALPPEGGRSLRHVQAGGEALSRELAQRFTASLTATLHNVYGPCETSITISHAVCTDDVTIGGPIDNCRVVILDEQLSPVPIGVPGELYVGGVAVGAGYIHRAELTAERFVPDPFVAGERLYATGDLGRRRPDGRIEFLGRRDHQVKLRGNRIELGEVEWALERLAGVKRAAVTVRALAARDLRLIAYVVGDDVDSDRMQAELKRILPDYMIPSAYVALDELPRLPSGKVDRRALPEPQLRVGGGEPPRTRMERLVAQVWSSVLRAEIGRDDDFFMLGGHSLLATRVMAELRARLQMDVGVRMLFERPILRDLAGELERHQTTGASLTLRRESGTAPVLSWGQERLWFLQQMFPDDASYNIWTALRLRGAVDEQALRAALNHVVARHDVLRASFAAAEGGAMLRLAERLDVDMPVEDLTSMTPAEREARIEAAVRETNAPFDLAKAPLLRARLLRCENDDRVLILVLHHIVTDGWSMNVLGREMLAAYESLRRGRAPQLAPLPLSYADYARWQRAWLSGAEREQQLDYWARTLEGAPEALDLPSDFARPEVQTFAGGRAELETSPQLGRRITAVARELGCTPFMIIAASFAALMARLTGSEDIVVGTPIANRPTLETESLIGFFMNSLALRIDTSGDPSFRELVERTKHTCLGAFAHQDIPFEQVLERVRPRRDLSRTPLFQVFLNLLSFEELSPSVELDAQPLEMALGGSKFDLTLYMRLAPEGPLHLLAVYNQKLFLGERIRGLLEQLATMLEHGLSELDEKMSAISLVSESARLPDPTETLDDSWCGAVHELFVDRARQQPDKTAVCDRHGAYSYAELDAASDAVAAELREKRVGVGDRVAIVAHRSSEMVLALLAVLKSGAAFVVIDPAYPTSRNLACLNIARPAAVIALEPSASAAKLEIGVPRLDIERGAIAKLARAGSPMRACVGPNDMAYIAFTSGTTGIPKGIAGRHGSLSHFIPWQRRRFGFGDADRYSMLSGLAHDPLHRDVFTPLQTGGTVCVPDPELFGDALGLTSWLAEQRITVAHLTPAMGKLLCESLVLDQRPELASLRYAFFLGEALHRRDVERFRELAPNVHCVNFYGSTETQRAVSYYELEEADGRGIPKATLPLGRGIADVQLLVMPRLGQLAGIGEVGEICVRSPHIALGYWQDEELTSRRFVPNPFRSDSADRCYRTGDLGRYAIDGQVEGLGRIDAQVQIRGFRVELGEIETAIAKHARVRDAVVIALESSPVVLCAYVVGDAIDVAELRKYLRGELPDYMVPTHVVTLAQIPLTPNRKVDRRALPPPAPRPVDSAAQQPQTELERVVAAAWCEVLERDRVDVTANFFDMGGHSLLVARLQLVLQKRLERDLPILAFFQHPTVEAFAAYLQDHRSDKLSNAAAVGAARAQQRLRHRRDLRRKR